MEQIESHPTRGGTTRFWRSWDGSSTAVQWFKFDDGEEQLYMHTNLGWLGPVDVELGEGETVEMVAERIAGGYELREVIDV